MLAKVPWNEALPDIPEILDIYPESERDRVLSSVPPVGPMHGVAVWGAGKWYC